MPFSGIKLQWLHNRNDVHTYTRLVQPPSCEHFRRKPNCSFAITGDFHYQQMFAAGIYCKYMYMFVYPLFSLSRKLLHVTWCCSKYLFCTPMLAWDTYMYLKNQTIAHRVLMLSWCSWKNYVRGSSYNDMCVHHCWHVGFADKMEQS